MSNNKLHTKPASALSRRYRRCNDIRRGPLAGKSQIVELISLGAPPRAILNKLCAPIDFQIGNVVPLFFLPDEQNNDVFSITQAVMQFGLNGFSSTTILSIDKSLLGIFQIYCCRQRRPNPHEARLITRVIRLAAVAFKRHEDLGSPRRIAGA